MIKIYIGKSAAGKDYFCKKDIKKGFAPIVSYTTRPMRKGEVNGIDYNFVSFMKFTELILNKELIEYRSYETCVGGKPDIWYYGTPKIKDFSKNYVVVVDIDGAKAILKEYPKECRIIYIEADEKIRTQRAKQRGSFDESEWKRRLADDDIKFSKEKLEELQFLYGKDIKVIANNEEI